MGFGVAQVECVDDHANVGGVFARLSHMGNLDQLERRLVHRCLESLVAFPVAIRLLDHDAAFEQQSLQHFGDVEAFVLGVLHAEGNVLEIAEHRHVGHFMLVRHRCVRPVAATPPRPSQGIESHDTSNRASRKRVAAALCGQ